jgi:hypothetical protein
MSRVQANLMEKFFHSSASGGGIGSQPMNVESLANAVFNRHSGIQRVEGILEYHLELASMGAQGGAFEGHNILVLK